MTHVRPHSFRAWWLAARPKTLIGAVVPVLVGTACAWADGVFLLRPALICLFFACLMQINANFINDLFDFRKGTDREDRLGPERACAQGWISAHSMKRGIAATTLLAFLVGSLLLAYGGIELIVLGVACVLFAFLYTAGPYPLAYKGWGDVLVVLFFGLVPVGGTYYVQAATMSPWTILAGLACGLAVDTLLVVNNYRDRDTDAQSGKRTLIVVGGETFGRWLYWGLGVVACLLCLPFAHRAQPLAALLPMLYLIPHYFTWRKMVHIRQGRALNAVLGDTSRNILIWGLLFSIGLALS